jgi:hypothetical protein
LDDPVPAFHLGGSLPDAVPNVARDGRKTILLFKTMGYPGIAVAVCFATASGAFIVALQHTTVANILLIQASTPLLAAPSVRSLAGGGWKWPATV